jgi:SAM-dependent methyltransferase
MPIVIEIEGVKYTWDPTKSTPDWPYPVPEMDEVVERLLKKYKVKKVIDFGCGRGRNAGLLARNFGRVYLVEVEKNMGLVREWVKKHQYRHCIALEWVEFKKTNIKVDACVLSFVLHTLPKSNLRRQIIETIKSKLNKYGLVVLITPAHDSKYREKHLKHAKLYEDGIIRLYPDGTFSFYKNYTLEELLEFLDEVGLEIRERIPGDHRYIVLASPKMEGIG